MAFTQYNYISNHYNDNAAPLNQQQWAEKAYTLIREEIIPQAPRNVLVSYAFPAGGRGKKDGKRIGECFTAPTDGKAAVIFIHPCQWTNPLDVLHVLAHEAVHAALPDETKPHGPAFAKLARSIGLEGKPTATHAGEKLAERLNAIAYQLGDFPAAAFDYGEKKKQTTRMRLYQCACDPQEAKEEGRTNKIRCGSDQMQITCDVCESAFELQQEKEKDQ